MLEMARTIHYNIIRWRFTPGTQSVSMATAGAVGEKYAAIAQQVEHFHGKEGVAGSIPAIGSRYINNMRKWRNWQTRKVEGLVGVYPVRVQVPSSAPVLKSNMEPWCSWLTRRPVTPKIASSSLVGSAKPLGCSQVGKAQDFDSCIPWFESRHPSHLAQIAQSVEQRTENPRVAGSIPALGTMIGSLAQLVRVLP